MLLDLRINELAEMRLQSFMCAFLVGPHQPRITSHISGADRGKSAVEAMAGTGP
jgi:hypothetical protein